MNNNNNNNSNNNTRLAATRHNNSSFPQTETNETSLPLQKQVLHHHPQKLTFLAKCHKDLTSENYNDQLQSTILLHHYFQYNNNWKNASTLRKYALRIYRAETYGIMTLMLRNIHRMDCHKNFRLISRIQSITISTFFQILRSANLRFWKVTVIQGGMIDKLLKNLRFCGERMRMEGDKDDRSVFINSMVCLGRIPNVCRGVVVKERFYEEKDMKKIVFRVMKKCITRRNDVTLHIYLCYLLWNVVGSKQLKFFTKEEKKRFMRYILSMVNYTVHPLLTEVTQWIFQLMRDDDMREFARKKLTKKLLEFISTRKISSVEVNSAVALDRMIVFGKEKAIQVVIDNGGIEILKDFFRRCRERRICIGMKYVLSTIAKMCAAGQKFIQVLIDNSVFEMVIEQLQKEFVAECSVKRMCLHCIWYALEEGSQDQVIWMLMNFNVIKILTDEMRRDIDFAGRKCGKVTIRSVHTIHGVVGKISDEFSKLNRFVLFRMFKLGTDLLLERVSLSVGCRNDVEWNLLLKIWEIRGRVGEYRKKFVRRDSRFNYRKMFL